SGQTLYRDRHGDPDPPVPQTRLDPVQSRRGRMAEPGLRPGVEQARNRGCRGTVGRTPEPEYTRMQGLPPAVAEAGVHLMPRQTGLTCLLPGEDAELVLSHFGDGAVGGISGANVRCHT